MAANCAAQRAAEAQPTSSALSPARAEDCGAHSNVSCGPPRREASARAALRAAKALPIRFRPQPAENEDGAGAKYFGPPHPGAAGRPLSRGLSYSLSAQSTANSSAQPIAQISSPCSAQRSTKTVSGFRARRTVAAQSSPQFSAPCSPHCGSAIAPPPFRAPCAIHLYSANRRNS